MTTLCSLTERFRNRGPLLHVVLDGWGVGREDDYNAIHRATLPNWSRLVQTCPYTQLWTHGPYVGLPDEQDLGGSEVGHMTMGAGEIKEQGPTLIKNLIRTGGFFESPVLGKLIQNCVVHDVPLHLIGLLSNGNIHSHIDHTIALIEHAFRSGVRRCYVHALLDGRDVPVQSANEYADQLEKLFHEFKRQNPEIDYAFASVDASTKATGIVCNCIVSYISGYIGKHDVHAPVCCVIGGRVTRYSDCGTSRNGSSSLLNSTISTIESRCVKSPCTVLVT